MPGQRFIIEGGRRLQGSVRISGAKNAALPAMAASLLTKEDVILEEVPRIGDVEIMAEVLRSLGAAVEWLGEHKMRLNAANIRSVVAPSDLVIKNRASFMVIGPLLARFGEAASRPPGGDVIGQRPVDVHLIGLKTLGAEIRLEGDKYVAKAPRLKGTKVFMDYPSHIGTENLVMAASLAKGKTVLVNTSAEPEVVDLAAMLNSMGAGISGAGSSTIEIEGVDELHGTTHRIIPDRLEAGTFAIAAVITGGEVELRHVDCTHMECLIWKLTEIGAQVMPGQGVLSVKKGRPLSAANVQALPYPGFATDLQATIGVLLTQACGISVVHERVYDNRLLYMDELRKMGIDVEINGQTAVIRGPVPLKGTLVQALDIRCGAALVLAGLAAEGITEVMDIFHLDRGYEDIDGKLRGLGAAISRTPPSEL